MSAKHIRQGDWNFLYDMPLQVDWVVTTMCNYQCSYCFGQQKLDKSKFSSWQSLNNAIKNLAQLNRPAYNITLSGGEPTTHPHFFDLLSGLAGALKDTLNQVLIITNGSRNVALYEKISKLAESTRVNLQISLHTEYVQLGHIKDILNTLERNTFIDFALMYNPNKAAYTHELHAALCDLRQDHPFNLSVVMLREPPAFDKIDSRYNQSDFAWQAKANAHFQRIACGDCIATAPRIKTPWTPFLTQGTENQAIKTITPSMDKSLRLQEGMLDFRNMYCAMGTGVIAIDQDGTCKGAQCRLATKGHLNIYKSIWQNADETLMIPVQCKEQNCGCNANYPIPKFVDKEEAEHFMRIFRTKQRRLMDEYQEKQMLLSRIEEGGAANDDVQPKTLLSCESSNPSLQFKRPLFEQGSEFAIRSVIAKSSLFDSEYYLAQYPDVALADMDPIFHYVRYGANEGRNPSPKFSTELYLKANPDVAGAGINPLYQYLISGKAKDREAFPCPQ